MTTPTPTRPRGVKPIGRPCPSCGSKGVTRQQLPLDAPLPPVGSCVVACRVCAYRAVVETKRWNEVAA